MPGQNFGPQPVAVAMNDQGYLLVQDTDPYDKRGPMVYFNHQLYTVNQGGYAGTPIGADYMSNVAADGSFWLAGAYQSSTDGTTHAVRWQVFADGTSSAPDVTHNRVLGPDTSSPGEQSEAHPTAINSSGQMVGYGQSYEVDVPMQWLPGDDTSYDVTGITYPGGVSWIDDAGNALGVTGDDGQGEPAPVYAGQILSIPTVNNYWNLASITGTKIVGSASIADTGSGTNVAFVYDVTTGGTTILPAVASTNGGTPYHNDQADRINASGDVVGQGSSDDADVLWKYSATTVTYTPYRDDTDLGPLVAAGTGLYLPSGYHALTGIAADGTLAVSYVEQYDTASQTEQNVIVLLKPGPDPRPVINPTDPTLPGTVTIHTEPGQTFSSQLIATNNPTAFTLSAENPDGSSTLPAGVNFDPTTGVISGTGPASGVYYLTATATNGQGYGAFIASVQLTSGDVPAVADQAVTEHLNQAFTYRVAATGATSVDVSGTYPAGVSLDSTTGTLSGTPTQSGTFPLVIYATNALGQTTANLTLTIDSKPPASFTVSLTKPLANQNVVAGTPLAVKAKVDLSAAGAETVASLVFLLDGQPVGAPLTAKPFKAIVPIGGSLSGAHTLSVVVTGNDGRAATSAPVTINVAEPFVDLTASTSFVPKYNKNGVLVIKGDYSISNLGNAPAGTFPIRFYLSNDANFDPSDLDLDALITKYLGKDPGFDQVIPGLPANTTLSTTDPGSLLPKIKVSVPRADVTLLGLSGKYILAVLDPDNTAGEAASTRANNVIAFQIP